MQVEGERHFETRGPGRPRGSISPDELRLLSLVRDLAPGTRSKTVLSTIEMAETLSFSPAKVKMLRRAMEDREFLEVITRSANNGAQMENAYRLTRKGRRMLAAYEEAFGLQEHDPGEGEPRGSADLVC